jgi:hypothetical protein
VEEMIPDAEGSEPGLFKNGCSLAELLGRSAPQNPAE